MDAADLTGRYTIDGVGRLYTDEEDVWLPSVSTVLDMRETPAALENWKRRTDNYEQVLAYAQNRGTLVHEYCLRDLVPEDPASGEPIKVLWGKDEEESEAALKENGEYDRFARELEWVDDAWGLMTTIMNIDDVIDAETFVINTDIGYAGQFDLLYYDAEADDVVLADIKTSSNVYEKHLIQLVAYSMAVPVSVDRMEVLRLNPDSRDWEIHSSNDWEVDPDELADEFVHLRQKLEQEKLSSILGTIKDADADTDGVMYEPVV